ncbi:hypothetical protein RY27_23905 [Litorilinea aerophila]|nr:hypothetical protein RY27_23905 [Litorilinea aerophila]
MIPRLGQNDGRRTLDDQAGSQDAVEKSKKPTRKTGNKSHGDLREMRVASILHRIPVRPKICFGLTRNKSVKTFCSS